MTGSGVLFGKWLTGIGGIMIACMSIGVMATEDFILKCRAVRDNLARLQCYDEIPIVYGRGIPLDVQKIITASFKGTGRKLTPPFTATKPFIVQAKGRHLLVTIYSIIEVKGRDSDVMVTVDTILTGSEGVGETYIEKPGRYKVNLFPYSITSPTDPWVVAIYVDQ